MKTLTWIASFLVAMASCVLDRAEAGTPGEEVSSLADQLKKSPAKPSEKKERQGLYLLEVESGTATLIADEPAAGLTNCGSSRWSRDGRRILFDATPGSRWNQAHVFAIDRGESGPKLTDLGPGNCPSPSPDGKRVAFTLNPGAVPEAKAGLWVMNADGSGRSSLGSFGRPFWSPDNQTLLIVGFSDPCTLSLMDVGTKAIRNVAIPGSAVFSIPSWVDEKTIVAAVGSPEGRSIALIDLTDPAHGKIKEILREKDGKPSVTPACPHFFPTDRRCFFVNANPKGMSLYTLDASNAGRPKRLERDGFDHALMDLSASPDGRYLVFCSDRAIPK